MRRATHVLAVALTLAVTVVNARAQDVVDRIVAKVENDIILMSDVQELEHYQLFVDGKSESQDQILDRLIDQWIVRSEARAALFPQPADAEVQRSLERLKRSFSSPEEYDARKKQSGLTDDEIEKMVRAQLYLSNYLDSRFRASIQIDDKAIEQFYKTRIVPRAESRGQTPPTLDAARGFIQEALVQRAINEQSDRWLKESRARLHVENLLSEKAQ
jgi:parvulin-like peptidyl-prolyl isomerase